MDILKFARPINAELTRTFTAKHAEMDYSLANQACYAGNYAFGPAAGPHI
jgi:hypothetical protein